MRNFSVEFIGRDFETGEAMYSCKVGCEIFIFTKPKLKDFLNMYIEDPAKTEGDFYARIDTRPSRQPNPPDAALGGLVPRSIISFMAPPSPKPLATCGWS